MLPLTASAVLAVVQIAKTQNQILVTEDIIEEQHFFRFIYSGQKFILTKADK